QEELQVLVEAPSQPPVKLFPSKRFQPARPVKIMPVLSPDNYMNLIPPLLASATRSLSIEQQYIRAQQTEIGRLLSSIQEAAEQNPELVVQIIVARPLSRGERFRKELQDIQDLGRKYGLRIGQNVRILNPKYFVHCHNKLLIVDEKTVLVSSQNWSDFAVTKNREAGLLIEYPDLARYYARIFKSDWETALKALP